MARSLVESDALDVLMMMPLVCGLGWSSPVARFISNPFHRRRQFRQSQTQSRVPRMKRLAETRSFIHPFASWGSGMSISSPFPYCLRTYFTTFCGFSCMGRSV